MKRSLAFVYVAVLFVSGVVVGALGMQVYIAHHGSRAVPMEVHGHGHGHGHDDEDSFLAQLVESLQLTPAQTEEVRAILERSRGDARILHENMLPQVLQHMEDMRAKILSVLDDEQRKKFEQFQRHHRELAEHTFLEY